MPTILLFAAAADAAGTRSHVVSAATVTTALEEASAALGPAFRRALGTSRVWLNGDQVEPGGQQPCGPDDAIVVLPPVSGG